MHTHLQIVPTADGSNTIYNAQVGENYHSKHGALQESRHVFLNMGLKYFIEKSGAGQVSVLEVGFGTGLNFLLTAAYCTGQNIGLNYTGIEAYPLTAEMAGQTDYHEYVPQPLWQSFITHYNNAIGNPTPINPCCTLQIAHSQLLYFSALQKFDVIYFDAFAAVHQPEMWNQQAINHTLNFLKPGGVFVTYAITGNLKRIIKAAGLQVEKAPGAPGKREMLRAVRP